MAQQERAKRTRQVILEAAGIVFDECGYEAATISQILARADVTRGALYFHFSSKEDLARGVLDTAVTTEGVLPQQFKLQELADTSLLLAHRMPREPLLRASLRLSVDQRARKLFGTKWPEWITVGADLLADAKARGELLAHVDPYETSRFLVGAWTGVQLIAEEVPHQRGDALVHEISLMYQMLLPNIAVPAVLARLDVAPDRPLRLFEAARSGEGGEGDTAGV
ncbi:ScbR family autoregulator-binding transcription factor [Streptomyces sp. UNOB3_S3]|uniref:ScbR family autoregulator-binding transcription factor n=1 Tax=Streptomyces sp. UNOB3_S3 TaxID=2871682 RepID=UPI001E4DB31D|nr:ScbR family autoregulator-binding transcription factor [Streptomyces sp. UNOB3_S3]MCC3773645.1 TetR/AcrR family transcriptional regulator [Streptomyces sp. UNOB3_S3]